VTELGLNLDDVATVVADDARAKATLRDAHGRIAGRIQRLEATAASLVRDKAGQGLAEYLSEAIAALYA
jgi:hypothetical protein